MYKYNVLGNEKNLVLYRGDSSKIDEFNIRKTNTYCLLGQGIYLTNKQSVAETYRDKGYYSHDMERAVTLFRGVAKNKEEAINNAWPEFLNRMHLKEYNTPFNKKNKNSQLFISRMQDAWYNMVADKTIEIEVTRNLNVQKVIVASFNIVLKPISFNKVGYITTFEFPADMFNRNVYKIDGHHNDDIFNILIEHMSEENAEAVRTMLRVGYVNRFGMNCIRNIIDERILATDSKRKQRHYSHWHIWNKLRDILEPYGIIGLEYDGGSYLGGSGYHRAFCIWDDDYVNAHKVCRRK